MPMNTDAAQEASASAREEMSGCCTARIYNFHEDSLNVAASQMKSRNPLRGLVTELYFLLETDERGTERDRTIKNGG